MKKVKVGKSKIHGNGLIADEPIKRGDVIELVHTIREIKPGVTKTTPTLLGRNYNHSDDANALNVIDGNNRYLVALKEIEVGGEITANYRANPDLEQPESFTSNDNYISFDYDDTLTTPEGFKLAKKLNEEGNNLYVITARDKITPQMIERAEAAGIPKENIITAGSDEAKVKIVKENNISKHIDNKESVIKALGDTGELFAPDKYPDLKADFVEMDLSDDDLNKLKEGGFIVEEYPDGGIVQLDGYKYKKDQTGKWVYESGAPITDTMVMQKLNYGQGKPVGAPVVQSAPKYEAKVPMSNTERRQKISDLRMSPQISDQEKADKLFEIQREQDIYYPDVSDQLILPPKNMSDLKAAEWKVNNSLGFPMERARLAGEAAAGPNDDPVDNFRHANAGRYTAEAIEDYTGNIPYISPAIGFIGSNLSGIGHELSTLFGGMDDRDWTDKLRESGEDIYNNYVGAKVGASDMTPIEKTNYLLYLSSNNKLPDGVVGSKNKKGQTNNMYFKKSPDDPGQYKSSYKNGGDPGKGKKGKSKNVQPFVTSDPAEYAYRKAAYDDSLNLYNLNKNYRDAADKYFFKQYEHLTKPTTKNAKAAIEEWNKTIAASEKWNAYKRKSKVPNKPSGSFKTYGSGHTGGFGDINVNAPGVKVLKKKGKIVLIEDSSLGYQKPLQPVVFQKKQKPIVNQEVIEPTPVPQPIPTPIPVTVNPELQKFVEERKPEPPGPPPGPGTDVMPVYDIDEAPMYATPDPDAEWVGQTERYIDWDANRIPYRLPRFRQPGHGGDLIKPGKRRYIPIPGIETRNSAYIQREDEEYQDGGEPKRKKYRFIKDTEEAKQFPADEWGQYIQEEPDVVVRPLTPEQQQERNSQRNMEFLQNIRAGMARNNPHLYLPDGTLRPQAVQAADWFWQLGMTGPAALKAAGSVLAKQIPKTGITYGTALNTAAGIHGATQVPQRIQDWQDVAAGEKDWREATAESLMTALELYGGYDAARTLLPQAYKINPWAFKADPEAYYHRSPNLENIINEETGMLQGFGESEAGKLYTNEALEKTGINLKKGANSKLYFSKGVPLDGGRYNSTRLGMSGQRYAGPYIAEVKGVPMGSSTKGRLPGLEPTKLESYAVSKRPISLDEVKFYKEHWLKGYKEVPRELPGSPNTSLELGKASRTVYPQPIVNSMGLREYGSTIHAGPEWGPIAPKRMILYNNSTYADPSLLDESMQPFLLPKEELMRRYPTDYMSKDELIGYNFKSGLKPIEYPTEIPANFTTQEDIMARILGKPLPSRAKPKVYYDLEGNPISEEEAIRILNTREYTYGGFVNRSKLNRFIK